jgi:hypothetical protein
VQQYRVIRNRSSVFFVFLGLVNNRGITSIITEGIEIFILHIANSSISLTIYVTLTWKWLSKFFSFISEEFKPKLSMATLQRAVPRIAFQLRSKNNRMSSLMRLRYTRHISVQHKVGTVSFIVFLIDKTEMRCRKENSRSFFLMCFVREYLIRIFLYIQQFYQARILNL